MATESTFVAVAKDLITEALRGQPLKVRQGAVLLYQVTVDNHLRVMSEVQVRSPTRGDSGGLSSNVMHRKH